MFLRNYLTQLKWATAYGVPMKGYFQWSTMDNFEWTAGYATGRAGVRRFQDAETHAQSECRAVSARWSGGMRSCNTRRYCNDCVLGRTLTFLNIHLAGGHL
jgi:beta-glucosidase/6-phospho-beta-glucosidase/beta-galactosidase